MKNNYKQTFDKQFGNPIEQLNKLSDEASKLGKRGGQATLKKYGVKHFSEAGKKGMAKRWGEKVK